MDDGVDPTEARDAVKAAADRSGDRFVLASRSRDEAVNFNDSRQAGAAFFAAEPDEQPFVVHAWNNQARTMARTEIHGTHETGEPRFVKSLPDSHAPDAEFRRGFLEAMESSLTERLGKIEHRTEAGIEPNQLDARLKDDLETIARQEPEKAAAIWAEHSDMPPPGPALQTAVQAYHAAADRELGSYYDELAEKPPVIGTGEWVTTDIDVELRPIAVATDRGIHAGYEAALPQGDSEVRFSERTFDSPREALKHAWDFYEGGEQGLEIAVARAAEIAREAAVDEPPEVRGIALELRAQPEFPRPETAIYAGADAQLVMTLGQETESSRNLADRLLADPEFHKIVETHISDVATTLGSGRFVDGDTVSLPDEVLTVTAPDRDGDRIVVAKLPDQDELSLALAAHLVESPVLAEHLQKELSRPNAWSNPAEAISSWLEESNDRIDRLPVEARQDLRTEMYGIAAEATSAFGLERERAAIEAAPRSALYAANLGANPTADQTEQNRLSAPSRELLKSNLQEVAREAGLDADKVGERLQTGAANAHQEEAWVKSDIADVAERHRLDLGDPKAASKAAEIVDRLYEKAAELLHAAQTHEQVRDPEPVIEALHKMAKVHSSQGAVAFRTEDQAKDFAEEMTERYGANILKDMAAGRTDALAKDVPDPAARQAIAQAVVAAAKEHPSLGFSAHEAEAAERSLAAQSRDRAPEHARERQMDREF